MLPHLIQNQMQSKLKTHIFHEMMQREASFKEPQAVIDVLWITATSGDTGGPEKSPWPIAQA